MEVFSIRFFFFSPSLGEEIIAYKPPGFNLMYHLLNESPMLELSLSLLEEGVKQLDTYAPFPGMCLELNFSCEIKMHTKNIKLILQMFNLVLFLLHIKIVFWENFPGSKQLTSSFLVQGLMNEVYKCSLFNCSFVFLMIFHCLYTAGKKHLEKAVQYCLALLNLTLQKENLFMDLLRESHLSLIVTPLEQLLQGINPRTKKADHVVNIARYVQSTEKGGVLEAQKCLDPGPLISFTSQHFSLHTASLKFFLGGRKCLHRW